MLLVCVTLVTLDPIPSRKVHFHRVNGACCHKCHGTGKTCEGVPMTMLKYHLTRYAEVWSVYAEAVPVVVGLGFVWMADYFRA